MVCRVARPVKVNNNDGANSGRHRQRRELNAFFARFAAINLAMDNKALKDLAASWMEKLPWFDVGPGDAHPSMAELTSAQKIHQFNDKQGEESPTVDQSTMHCLCLEARKNAQPCHACIIACNIVQERCPRHVACSLKALAPGSCASLCISA